MKYNKIALVGLMGCGKSAVSKLLASKLKLKHFELDEIFVQQQGISILQFFEEFGEEKFRKIETQILNDTLVNNDDFVLSTGGGVILSETNRDLLFNKEILTIYLKTEVETILKRISNDNSRPLLKVENPKLKLENLISQREKYYLFSNFVIETDLLSVQEIVNKIIDII